MFSMKKYSQFKIDISKVSICVFIVRVDFFSLVEIGEGFLQTLIRWDQQLTTNSLDSYKHIYVYIYKVCATKVTIWKGNFIHLSYK